LIALNTRLSRWKTLSALSLLSLALIVPFSAWGKELNQSIFLKTGLSLSGGLHVPVKTNILLNNDYDQVLHNTRIIQISNDNNLATIQAFQPGQSVSLQFMNKGEYQICFSLSPSVDVSEKCLQVNVVSLQAA